MDRNEHHTSHRVERVQLPSGKTIEVVHFGDAVEQKGDLHLCRACGSTLVYPTSWSQAGESAWEVGLRCPDCEKHSEGIFSHEAVEAFDDELEAGSDALARDLRRLTHANMADEASRFVAALAVDAIVPEDF